MNLVTAQDLSNELNVANGAAVPGDPVVEVTFTVPADGKVLVHVAGHLSIYYLADGAEYEEDSIPGVFLGAQVYAAAAAPGGTRQGISWHATREYDAARLGDAIPVTGLTPGDFYKARLAHWGEFLPAGAVGKVRRRRITVLLG